MIQDILFLLLIIFKATESTECVNVIHKCMGMIYEEPYQPKKKVPYSTHTELGTIIDILCVLTYL